MGECKELRTTSVILLVIYIGCFPALLCLASALRRNIGPLSTAARAAIPVILILLEVDQLWQIIASHEVASRTLFGVAQEFLKCQGLGRADSVLLASWLLPYAAAALLLALAVSREVLAVLAQMALQQVTEAAREEGSEVGFGAAVSVAAGLRAALVDMLAGCVLLFLAAHVLVAQAVFRGFSCAFGALTGWDQEGCGDAAFWVPFTLLAALLNVGAPVAALAWVASWARTVQFCGGTAAGAKGQTCSIPGSFAMTLRRRDTSLKRQVLHSIASIMSYEPWFAWQLLGDALAVAGMELGVATGTDRGHQLGIVWAHAIIFGEVVVLLWPRWLLDARLLRFNSSMRIALLVASHVREAIGFEATWPWPVAVAFIAISAVLVVGAWISAGGAASALQATCSALGIKKCQKRRPAIPISPLVGLARDLSQGSLFIVLNEPAKFTAMCGSFSADESLCLSAAAELVSGRLLSATVNLHGDLSTAAASLNRRNSVEVVSAALTHNIVNRSISNMSIVSNETSHSGSSDWVAPLPLLASDDDSRFTFSRKKSREPEVQKDVMLTKKWLLDHFVPASNGPEVNDSLPLGASAVSNIIGSPPTKFHSRSQVCLLRSSEGIVRFNSESAEDVMKISVDPHAKPAPEFSRSSARMMPKSASSLVSNGPLSKVSSRRPSLSSGAAAAGPPPALEFFKPGTVFDPSDLPGASQSSEQSPREVLVEARASDGASRFTSEARASDGPSRFTSEGASRIQSEGSLPSAMLLTDTLKSFGDKGGSPTSSPYQSEKPFSPAKPHFLELGAVADLSEIPALRRTVDSSTCSAGREPEQACMEPPSREHRDPVGSAAALREQPAEAAASHFAVGSSAATAEKSADAPARQLTPSTEFSLSTMRKRCEEMRATSHNSTSLRDQFPSAGSLERPMQSPRRRLEAWQAWPQTSTLGPMLPEAYHKLLDLAPPNSLLRMLSSRCDTIRMLPSVDESIVDELASGQPSNGTISGGSIPSRPALQSLPIASVPFIMGSNPHLVGPPPVQGGRGGGGGGMLVRTFSNSSVGQGCRHRSASRHVSTDTADSTGLEKMPSVLSIASSQDTTCLLEAAIRSSKHQDASVNLLKELEALRAENMRLRLESEEMRMKADAQREQHRPMAAALVGDSGLGSAGDGKALPVAAEQVDAAAKRLDALMSCVLSGGEETGISGTGSSPKNATTIGASAEPADCSGSPGEPSAGTDSVPGLSSKTAAGSSGSSGEEKIQPSTQCVPSQLPEAVAIGTSEDKKTEQETKSEQWEKWKARRDAKKAQAGKTKYGEWLKNMADGYGG